jgi:hypothetical protein
MMKLEVAGKLICSGQFDGKNHDSLVCDGAVIKGGISLKKSNFIGRVSLSGTQIKGDLDC